MYNEIFSSARYFVICDYSPSLRRLLIRADKRKGYDINLDIVFFDTDYIQLASMLNGIKVHLLDKTSASVPNIPNYEALSKYLSFEDNNLFELESNDGAKYYIAASFVKVFENEFEFNETSLNLEKQDQLKEIASSR
ncbi:MAG: hypothetical protein AAF363_00165 [Bacteroidota bacterium]